MAQSTYSSSRAIGYEGALADQKGSDIHYMRNDEASAEMRFGHAVKFDSATDESSAKILTATSETVAGIVMKDSYESAQLGDAGPVAGQSLSVIRKGRIYARCEDGCSVGDRLFIRAVATGAENPGALRAAADGTDCIDSQGQGQWMTSAAAGEIAVLDFDFSREP